MDPKVQSGRIELETLELEQSGGDACAFANVKPDAHGNGPLQGPDHARRESKRHARAVLMFATSLGVGFDLKPRRRRAARSGEG